MEHAPSGFFVARTPARPFSDLLEGDLRAWAARPDVRDALWTASAALGAAADAWVDGGGEDRKLEIALTRYRARMSGRCSPFGLLAGWSTGVVGRGARLQVGRGRPRSRAAVKLAEVVAARSEPLLRDALVYAVAPAVHESAGRIRWVCDGRLEGAEPDDELRAVLAAAPGTRAELASAVGGAAEFVDELIEAGLLVPELFSVLATEDPAAVLAERLRALPGGEGIAGELDAAIAALADLDAAPPGERAGRRPAYVAGARVDAHVELPRPAPGLELPEAVAREALRGLDVLRRLTRAVEPPDLRHFRERFAERHDRRAVPLLEALDPESGLGYGPDATAAAPEAPAGAAWTAVEQALLRIVTEARDGEADLAPSLGALEARDPAPLPDAFAVLATCAATDADALAAGDFELLLHGAYGPSGARLLGRFCGSDPELRAHVETHLRAEEALEPDAVFAEILHGPGGRAGDIVARPRLREHAIGLDAPDAIAPADLDLALEDGRLVLRRRSDGRRVEPRLTSAHDVYTGRGLGLYRFLAHLQFQDAPAGVSWSWGPLESASRLPRVRAGRVVLAPARWRIAPWEVRRMAAGAHEERVAAVARWREEADAPRLVALQRPGVALPVDLDDPLGAEVLLRAARDGEDVVVHEWWPAPDRMPVDGPDGRLHHELVIPFVSTRAPSPPRPAPRHADVHRTFPPGSAWSSLKLYCGTAVAERIVAEDLPAVVAGRRWHFLRYADPEHHLRIRVLGGPDGLLALGARMVDEGLAWRAVLDTYEREVERYGDVEVAEQVFHADSRAVAELLAAPREVPRALLAVAGVELLLRDLGLSAAERHAVAAAARAQLLPAAGSGAARRELSGNFRRDRDALEALIDDPPDAFLRRSAALAGADLTGVAAAAGSLAHMHVNRLLTAASTRDELAVCDALDRLHRGWAARAGATAR